MDQTTPPAELKKSRLSPITQRRWENFKANKRGSWSLWIFIFLFLTSLFAEVIANDKPIIASYNGELLLSLIHISEPTRPY